MWQNSMNLIAFSAMEADFQVHDNGHHQVQH